MAVEPAGPKKVIISLLTEVLHMSLLRFPVRIAFYRRFRNKIWYFLTQFGDPFSGQAPVKYHLCICRYAMAMYMGSTSLCFCSSSKCILRWSISQAAVILNCFLFRHSRGLCNGMSWRNIDQTWRHCQGAKNVCVCWFYYHGEQLIDKVALAVTTGYWIITVRISDNRHCPQGIIEIEKRGKQFEHRIPIFVTLTIDRFL